MPLQTLRTSHCFHVVTIWLVLQVFEGLGRSSADISFERHGDLKLNRTRKITIQFMGDFHLVAASHYMIAEDRRKRDGCSNPLYH